MSKDNVQLFLYPPTGSQQCPRYAYTGGNRDHGNIRTTFGRGASDVLVTLSEPERKPGEPRRYRIVAVEFHGPGRSQFSWRAKAQDHMAVIDNEASGASRVEYLTLVEDKQSGEVFACDPFIKNVPPI
jgi:hypothetical protein